MTDLSVLITALPSAPEIALPEVARLGFRRVDLVGKAVRPEAERQALAESGMVVDCVALGRDLPVGCTLDAIDASKRRRAVDAVQEQIAEAAQIGARVGYIVPGKDAAGLPAFADACQVLSAFARGRMIRLCIEHFPGSVLPTASGTLDWLNSTGLQNVQLLLDLGHCLISGEDPCAVVIAAGDKLGYVQLDDNDGVHDVHWPLLSGVLTEAALQRLLRRLDLQKAPCGIALELNGKLDDPIGNIAKSKKTVEQLR